MGDMKFFWPLPATAILPPVNETGESGIMVLVMALEGSALMTFAAVLMLDGEAVTILAFLGSRIVSPEEPILLGVLKRSFVGVPLIPPCWKGIVRIWVPKAKHH